VYQTLSNRLRDALARHIQQHYGVEFVIVLDRPPKIAMGEVASPVCFDLAKRLKKAPRILAQEIAAGLGKIEGIARVEVAGAGYLNAYFDRAAFWEQAWKEQGGEGQKQRANESLGKIIVEHTSINPNKAAHVGHLRNAILGDTFVRMLRAAGEHTAEDLLPQIRVPTLIVAGEKDTFTPAHLARTMQKAIPGAELLMVPGGSHVVPIEQHKLVSERIVQFLKERVET